MAHKVRITSEAEAELRGIGDYIASQGAPQAALRFVKSIRGRIVGLRTFPEAYELAPEAAAVGVELRLLIHGMYRILYTIDDNEVTIHAVRHGARRPLRPDELPPKS
jgi:plasmid stabilization system protein ParE